MSTFEHLKQKKLLWERNKVQPALEKFPERQPRFVLDSGIEVERLSLPRGCDYEQAGGFSGQYPFTRGVYPTMYRGKFWTMRQYAGFGTAEESNERYRYLLEHGTTGLSVAFDLPTQMGYDSDHPFAEGEVGKAGVAIDSLQDMEMLFAGVDLEKITVSMTINATAPILLCMYVALAKKQGADLKKISGTVQNDILKEFAARGTHIYPPEHSLRLVTDTICWCSENLPRWNPISISGYHIREAGSTAVQELTFTFANAVAYVQSVVDVGLEIDRFAPKLSFFFNAHNNFFEEIAKFRAARRIWAKIMRERFGARDDESMKLRFHAQTGGSTLTARQIDNNVIRVTMQALAAVLGGCQSLHTNARDEALALPTEESACLALRTQQVIAYESGVADAVDPLGGSYYVEYLTDEVEKRVWQYLEKIDAMGGAVKAIENNFYQDEIARSAYEHHRAIEKKAKIIVGVNKFTTEDTESKEVSRVDESVSDRQVDRLRNLRTRRDQSTVDSCLRSLRRAAASKENVISHMLSCVEADATLGEISDALREVWGEWKQ
ncbi:MAG: methylmalonyl-CoA mutase family protein [Bacteroidota bacterium]